MSAPPTPTMARSPAPSSLPHPDLDVSYYKQRVAQLEKEVRVRVRGELCVRMPSHAPVEGGRGRGR